MQSFSESPSEEKTRSSWINTFACKNSITSRQYRSFIVQRL
ncbi:hypothetical protein M153_3400014922 [Pseudoloma neurophilia]|uniref:Uncharacterized protein n=1 Tax=Pseudoloma neurophilia TaxID=146866 RepID=A0A0R0M7L7_9MICR|nr:hypothetical protein M153_3400014922 [Pseudoloma neurophilia]